MKKQSLITILTAIFLFAFLSNSINAQKSVDLKYNLNQGDQYGFIMTTDIDMSFDANGMIMTLENSSIFESIATVQNALENEFTIETQIKRIKSTQKMFGMEVNYDSDDPSTAQNPMTAQIAAALSSSIEKSYTIVMDEKGKISKTDMSQLSENEDIVKSVNSGFLYANYPEQKIKIGESWEKDIAPVKESDMKMHAKYTLLKLTGKTATIQFDGTISANTMQDMDMKMDGTQKGEMIVDVNTGWLIESSVDQEIELDIEQNGQKFPASISGTIKTVSAKK